MTGVLEIPAMGRIFEGHFPGRPILPGVAQLALIARAIGAAQLRGIPYLRFRSTVAPGERLAIRANEGPGGVAVEVTRGGRPVTAGSLVLGRPGGPPDAATAIAARRVVAAPPLDALLPHRPPMRFVTRIVGEAEDGMTCEAEIPTDCALAEDGRSPAFVTIEAAAQTAAVWEALRRVRGAGAAEPRIGYLVGLEGVEFFAERVTAGVAMLATVALDAAAPPLAHYRAEVSIDGMPVVRGVVAVLGSGPEPGRS